ncbi:MAG: hypothetical protein WA322_11925 [Pseudolabrys sp.]
MRHRRVPALPERISACPTTFPQCVFTAKEGRHEPLDQHGSGNRTAPRHTCGVALASRTAVVDAAGNRAVLAADQGTIIGSRPSGCPHSYCGCGWRMYLGLSDLRLNLASRLFPHESAPRAGLAAVRSGHVMYIEAAAGNGQWLIRDYNSGGGLSRVHVRDVGGYAFVNPHAQLATR